MESYLNFQKKIKYLFTDIDDTLTEDGQLHADAYEMLWKLAQSGVSIVPITGRPAGWCEMIARLWPVTAIIGENGAFYFRYQQKKMERFYCIDENMRVLNRQKLDLIANQVLTEVPGTALASDQFTRLFDLAIDFCEDVDPLPNQEVQKIVEIFHRHGATAKVSSIHVNGWFGTYDKKSMCEIFYKNQTGRDLSHDLDHCAFIGDSPNDEPLFAAFTNSFAVANIKSFISQIKTPPQYVTQLKGGKGFVEFGEHLLTL